MSPPFNKRLTFGLISSFLVIILLSTNFSCFASSGHEINALSVQSPNSDVSNLLTGTGTDLTLNQKSANLSVTKIASKYQVSTEEYVIIADYTTSFIEYRIKPYYTTDYILYKRVNPQYPGDGIVDQNGNALDSVSMTISNWGQSGNVVWFIESCAEFSLKQSFTIYRDYFELNVTYSPGSKKVLTTYYIGLCSSTGSLYNLMNGQFNRYIPGFPEDTPSGYGLGGWYPSFKMYAPACDLRVPNRDLGVEWGYEDTVAYIGAPVWLSGGSGGNSAIGLKYTSLNSIVPNIALGAQETFHMFVRPYQYTDGQQHGYDVGYAKWVAPKIAAKFGHHSDPVFPLTVMGMTSWSASERSWVENSQVKVAVYSNNPDQIDWNYKSAQLANMNPDTPNVVPSSWQIMKPGMVPLTTSDGSAICNPVSGPYTTQGTYRWQLINNDPQEAWWTSTSGVYWDELNIWDVYNKPKNDYQQRADYVYDGYLALIKDTYASGYWDYVVANSYTALLHLSIATDLTAIEGYEPSSTFNTDMTKHVQSTMNFVNNIPSEFRPNILVYQNYATGSSSDQTDVYSALFGAAKYGYFVDLTSYDSFESQKHNLVMAEDMFKAMGCTRNSDARTISVDTLDLAKGTSLSTAASMVVMKGAGTPTITSTTAPGVFKLTNLLGSSRSFDLGFNSQSYYQAGSNVQSTSYMTYASTGKGTFHGSITAEKTGEVVKNPNLLVQQKTSGTISVGLVSLTSTQAELNLAATGGSTTITLKGMKASSSFNIFVDGVLVTTINSGADGSLSYSRAFGTSDVLKVQLSGTPGPDPPPTPVQGMALVNPTSADVTTLNDVDLQYKVTDANGNPIVNGFVTFYIQHADGATVWTWANAVTDSQGIAHCVYKASSVTGGATPGPTEYYNAWAVFQGCYAYQWVLLPSGSWGANAHPFPVVEGTHIKVHMQASAPEPPPVPVPVQGMVRLNPISSEITTLGDVDLQYKVTDANGNPIVNGFVTFYIQHADGATVWTWANAVTDSQGIAHCVYKASSVTGGATPGPTEYYNAWAVFQGCYAYQWVLLPSGSWGANAHPFPVVEGTHIKVHLQSS